jgi:hypothetical protein
LDNVQVPCLHTCIQDPSMCMIEDATSHDVISTYDATVCVLVQVSTFAFDAF